jgi:hypothetical protein
LSRAKPALAKLAYWPDGSLKWTGFATVVPAGFSHSLSTDTTIEKREGYYADQLGTCIRGERE